MIKNCVLFEAVLRIMPRKGDSPMTARPCIIEGNITPIETLRGQRGKLFLQRVVAGKILLGNKFDNFMLLHAGRGASWRSISGSSSGD